MVGAVLDGHHDKSTEQAWREGQGYYYFGLLIIILITLNNSRAGLEGGAGYLCVV